MPKKGANLGVNALSGPSAGVDAMMNVVLEMTQSLIEVAKTERIDND